MAACSLRLPSACATNPDAIRLDFVLLQEVQEITGDRSFNHSLHLYTV